MGMYTVKKIVRFVSKTLCKSINVVEDKKFLFSLICGSDHLSLGFLSFESLSKLQHFMFFIFNVLSRYRLYNTTTIGKKLNCNCKIEKS